MCWVGYEREDRGLGGDRGQEYGERGVGVWGDGVEVWGKGVGVWGEGMEREDLGLVLYRV